MLQIFPYEREITNSRNGIPKEFEFQLGLIVQFTLREKVSLASARIYCQKVGDPKISKSFAVFSRGTYSCISFQLQLFEVLAPEFLAPNEAKIPELKVELK